MKSSFLRLTLLPAVAALALLAPAHAADPKPKAPSKREAREMEKVLTARFQSDATFTKQQRGFFDQSNVVGRPIAVVIQERGPATRVMDDGAGGKIYAYETGMGGQTGEYVPGYTVTDGFGTVVARGEGKDTRSSYSYTAYTDFYVNPQDEVSKVIIGVRGRPPTERGNFDKIWSGKIKFPGKTRADLAATIRDHVKTRGYVLRADSDDHIVYRHFTQFGTAQECGADLYGNVRVTVKLLDGELDAQVDVEKFSSVFGAKMIMNANGDIASENDVPFNHLRLIAPPKARKAFPEAMYDHKMKVLNPVVIRKIDLFQEGYSKELLALAN
jgi:hypothetical protein